MNSDWEIVIRYLPLLIKGAIFTVILSILSLFFGTILGLFLAVFQISKIWILNFFSHIYILIIRSIPLLLILFFIFYLPSIIFKVHVSKFFVAILSLTLYSSAYAAEIIRSGFLSIPKEQSEAGLSLGLTKLQVMRFIMIPQIFKVIIPPYVGLFTAVVKDSSLVSVICYIELTRATRLAVMSTFKSFEFYAIALILYFVICYPLSLYSKKAEKMVRR